jgi:phosphoribosylanthranilate isomerase
LGGVTRIKVCGLTRAEDVRVAVALGAWALGFVLTDSPRRIDAASAGALAAAAGDALTVAVVTTESPASIATSLQEAGLRAVQLSAGADGPTVTEVRTAAAHLRPRPLVIAAADTPDAGLADFVLLDARAPGRYGGSGRQLDWDALAADPATPRGRLVLAGGLTPEDAGAAIVALEPAAVDVSSGVESAPGVKDASRLRAFFLAVGRADSERATQAARATREDG